MSVFGRAILIWAAVLLSAPAVLADGFDGLEPGRSCRGEVYRKLGEPISVATGGKICYFDPAPYKGKTVRAVFFDSGILREIVLEPGASYSREQYEKWLGLGTPSGHRERDGIRTTLYDGQGVKLIHESLSPDSLVASYVHYSADGWEMEKQRAALEDRFHAAVEKGDCAEMRSAFTSGQKRFPNVAWFYADEISWTVKCDPDFRQKTNHLVSLSVKSAELNPTDDAYRFLAFVHVSITKDPAKALAAFNHLDLNEHPDIHAYLGGCYMELGNKAEARKHFQVYLKQFPNGELAATSRAALKKLK